MSGYLGNPDAESEYMLDYIDAQIRLAQSQITSGTSAVECNDCGDVIPEGRRLAVPGCKYCVNCQEQYDGKPRLNFLTKML